MDVRFSGRTLATLAIVLGMVFGSIAGAAEPAAPAASGPAEQANAAKAEYDVAVRKAEEDLAAARKAYVAKLDAALKSAMQAGDLPEANRIDALRKSATAAGPAGAGKGNVSDSNSDAGKTADQRRKPGWIVGRITDARGESIVDATFDVVVYGTTIQGGQRSEFKLEVDNEGRFEQELPDGLYAVKAYVIKEFESGRYRLQLHPNDDKHEQTKVTSKPGIVKDFTWKLSGLRPGYDPKNANSYYGPALQLYDANYLGEEAEKLAAKYGAKAKAVITLTPRTSLIDGSKGAVVTINAPLADIGRTIPQKTFDVPVAVYKAEAKVVTPDGKEHPLKASTAFRGPWEQSADVKFVQKSEYSDLEPVTLYVHE